MTKSDFVWSVGFQGNTAIVNKAQRGRFHNLSFENLVEKGYLRAAFCSAIWDAEKTGKTDAPERCAELLAKKSGRPLTLEQAKRLVGVYVVPDDKIRVIRV